MKCYSQNYFLHVASKSDRIHDFVSETDYKLLRVVGQLYTAKRKQKSSSRRSKVRTIFSEFMKFLE